MYYKLCPCLNNVIRFERKPFLDPMGDDDLKDQLMNVGEVIFISAFRFCVSHNMMYT